MANRVVTAILTANVGQYVSAMQQAATATGAPSAAAVQGAQQTQSAMQSAGVQMVGFGIAAGVAGLAAVRAFADFDAAMSSVQAATRESGASLDALREAALEAGESTVFSATEAAGAVEALAKAGVSTADILGGALSGSLDLAAAGGLDVAAAAEIAATAMTQFGLEGTDVTHIADLLAAGAGKAQGEVTDLAAALNQSGLVASQFGLSIEETTGTLAAFAAAGLLGSDAGTSFRTMLLRLANPSGEAADEMERLGIAAYDASGNFVGMESLAGQLKDRLSELPPAQRDAALATIFGSDAIRAANVLYKNGAEGIAQWTANVDDQGFAAETAAIKLDNLRGDLEALSGAFETALIRTGEAGNGPLRGLVQLLTNVVGAYSALPSAAQTAALAAVGLATAIGVLGGAFLLMQARLVIMQQQLAFMAFAFPRTAAAVTALAGPIGIAVAALSALAIASQYAGDSQETLQKRLGSLKDAAGPNVKDQIRALREEIEELDAVAAKEYKGSFLGMDLYAEFTNVSRNAGNQAKVLKEELKTLEAAEAAQRVETEKLLAPMGAAGEALLAAGDAAGLSAEGMKASADAVKELAEVFASFIDPMNAYTDLLGTATEEEKAMAQATADATASSADSWEDYVGSVAVSVSEYLAELERQVAAQMAWESNMLALAGRVSQGTLDELARMGPEGAPLVANLVNASDAELARMDELFGARTDEATGAAAARLRAAAPVLAAIAGVAGSETAAQLGRELAAGTTTVEQIMARYGVVIRNGVPTVVATEVRLDGIAGANAAADAYGRRLNAIPSVVTTTITSRYLRTGQSEFAHGGIVEPYAAGGITEYHRAQIAPAGAMRLWAEPETGGEAYIPLAAAKRPQSEAILSEVASRFGYVVVREDRFANAKPYASGGVTASSGSRGATINNNFNLDSPAAAATAKGYAREVLTQMRRDAALHGRAVSG